MIESEFSSFYALAESTPPNDVSVYVEKIGWKLNQRSGDDWEQWIEPKDDGSPKAAWFLPLSREFADYDRRMAQLLHAVAEQQSMGVSELRSELENLRSDSFYLMIEFQEGGSLGDVHLVPRLYEVVGKLIDDSARFTDFPSTSFGGGRRSERLQRLMRKELTMEASPGPEAGVAVHVRLQLAEARRPRVPFGRQVVENLFLAFQWLELVEAARSWTDPSQIWNLGNRVAGTLADFSQHTGAISTQFSFAWSGTVPLDPGISSRIFSFDHLDLLARRAPVPPLRITDRLAASAAPATHRVNFSGKITDVFFGRPAEDGSQECWISLPWKEGSRTRTLRIGLSQDDCLKAAAAKVAADEVSVEGIALTTGRGVWAFEGTLTFPDGRTVTVRHD